ncbi:MAG: hypothetical protein JXR70_13460 [Spirochaetales bacterium]|nr:hypothetical protein [Spirochaetales bacterium]
MIYFVSPYRKRIFEKSVFKAFYRHGDECEGDVCEGDASVSGLNEESVFEED